MSFRKKVQKCHENRARSKSLPIGSAPFTTSLFYKQQPETQKSAALRWDHLLSRASTLQTVSPLKIASRGQPMISLGTARPTPEYYPWKKITLECLKTLGGTDEEPPELSYMSCATGEAAYDLAVAMNYGYSAGSPQALRFITEHVEMIHDPPYDDWACCLTCGTTSALDIALRVFCNPGDIVLTEKFTYTGTLTAIKSQGLRTVGIEMDDLGLLPDDIDKRLQNWDDGHEQGSKPRVLYMIPTGQNPTGSTQSPHRRREIYRIAVKHDLFIFEDDPYYFLNMGTWQSGTVKNEDRDNYLANLPPSYLSLDTCGRVLRMDTASKILAPGLRCGWVTGCSQIIDKFISLSEVGVSAPSGPSQVMLFKLLDETWGHLGFVDWLHSLSREYLRRRDILLQACRDYLPMKNCSWMVPDAGMFVWIKINVSDHASRKQGPSSAQGHHLGIEDHIYTQSQANGVLVSKGSWFARDGSSDEVFFRLTFAAAPEHDLVRAVQGFADAVRSEFSVEVCS
ncbi:hypothetical protein PFICI_09491 [Pestalotiopsis fici W106-1]|uniref:Aminotransferase class I/classII large domain-containing protein n=1 Tax=Pestalotiopsis fici (strain W106-1 / CGMCC3.15140) TaxID=1229662 RepID=W3X0H5_PESFW|nr:uncharacterized protein PFICI_09491 [Pestalotiopsis fici W106-1]ETS79638.1 hypothetical protein PFICI_09491 [Pestalotiopsis fici W106-1]